MHRPTHNIVITFVAGQHKIIQIGVGTYLRIPIVIAQHRKEAVACCTWAIRAGIRINKVVIVKADVQINRGSETRVIVVVAQRGHKIGLPTLDALSHI